MRSARSPESAFLLWSGAVLDGVRLAGRGGFDELVKGVSGKNLILRGSLCRKALDAGIIVTSVQPKAVLNLVINIAKG